MTEQAISLKDRTETLNLFWLCEHAGKKYPAGVAFYNQEQGDFRLKVDLLPEDKVLFLKAVSSSGDVTHFRVESAVRKSGRITHRAEVGTGYLRDGDPSIYMDLGPFSRTLVLEQE